MMPPPEPPVVTLNFLYQLIGQKEVEKAVLIEQLHRVQAEVAEIRKLIVPAVSEQEAEIAE